MKQYDKMDPKIKKAWVVALRSRRFKQGRGRLKQIVVTESKLDQVKHCCLGVLCELYAEAQGKSFEEEIVTSISTTIVFLPKKVQAWAGLTSCDPEIDAEGTSLADLNDGGKSFRRIATIIEKVL